MPFTTDLITGMLTVCGQLFSDYWIIIALLIGVGIAMGIFETLTKSEAMDDDY